MESLGNFHSIDIHRPMHSECSSSFNRIGSFVMNLWRSFLVTFFASLPLCSFYENTDASFGMKMISDQLLQRQIKLLFNSKKSLVMKMQIKNVIKNRLFKRFFQKCNFFYWFPIARSIPQTVFSIDKTFFVHSQKLKATYRIQAC